MKKIFIIFLLSFCLTGVYAQRNTQKPAPVFFSEAFFDFLIDNLQGSLWNYPDTGYMEQLNSITYWSSLDYEALFAVYSIGMSGQIIVAHGAVYLPLNIDERRINQIYELAQKCAGKYAKVAPEKTDSGLLYKTNNKKTAPSVISENVHVYLSLEKKITDNGRTDITINFLLTTEP